MPKFALSDLSMGDRTQMLSRALSASKPAYCYCYIRDVYDTYLVYRDYDNDATYKVDYTIADDYTVTFGDPTEVIERTVYEPVKMGSFALTSAFVSSNKVNLYPESLLFEIHGTSEYFPGQDVTVTEADLADIAALFTSASMGLEHEATVLGDNCGAVQDVWLDETGRKLFGTVAIPKGLDELIPPGPRKVSVEIFRNDDGKMYIPKVDLVLNPQIEHAALMKCAAFAKGETPTQPVDPAIQPSDSARPARQGKEIKRMSGWDKVKAALEGAGFKFGENEPAVDPAAADLARKAAEFDKVVAEKRTKAKADAIIAFGKEVGTAKAGFIDTLPEGEALDHYAAELAEAARKFTAGNSGGVRRTAANNFASDADAGTPVGEFKASTYDENAVYASRAAAMGKG